jgi:hypothetical protein
MSTRRRFYLFLKLASGFSKRPAATQCSSSSFRRTASNTDFNLDATDAVAFALGIVPSPEQEQQRAGGA